MMTFLDGGMGTELQAKGLRPGEIPEDWNVERPDAIASVHRAYVEAGSQIVYANTFGANRLKYHGRYALADVIRAAVANARNCRGEDASGTGVAALGAPETEACETGRGFKVALDVGPTGKLLKPAGDLAFEAAYEAFAEQIRLGAEAGADLVVVETMSDLYELKAAVLAAKENCSLPVYATVALGTDGKLLTGGSVECVATLLESLGVDAYGFNCGLGPDEMLPYVERLAKVSTKPIIAKPNAGLPKVVDGKTVFLVGPEEFAGHVAKLVAAGASIVGGCCGTTPAHVKRLFDCSDCSTVRLFDCSTAFDGRRSLSTAAGAPDHPNSRTIEQSNNPNNRTIVCSGVEAVELRPYEGLVIGERINPTGKKLLKEAFLKGDVAYVLREAVKQVDAGARILDVNCGVPGIDEAATLEATVEAVQSVATCPLQIDTANPAALERALRRVNGKALVNSVNGKRESMDAVFPLVKKYGGTIVALCLDETGIPETAEGRLAIARKILAEGAKWGFAEKDFVFDALTLAVSAQPDAAQVTLETVKRLTEELHVNTVLGVSNVSFGLPNRPALNNAMYALAKRAGLSAAIANPSLIAEGDDPMAIDVLLGRDKNCARWVAHAAESSGAGTPRARDASGAGTPRLRDAIRRGLRDDARCAAEAALAAGRETMAVIQEEIVPALEEVGKGFETGRVYLPQLLMAADAAGEAFAVVKAKLAASTALGGSRQQSSAHDGDRQPSTAIDGSRRPIVLATVEGDIHDIGKNIVRALLENYGFEVIDLGRDVPPAKIVEAAKRSGACLVGLSALMTTTVGAMAETVRELKAAGLGCKTVVGGAVVTQDYADSIGADFYAKDAMRAVRIAEEISERT